MHSFFDFDGVCGYVDYSQLAESVVKAVLVFLHEFVELVLLMIIPVVPVDVEQLEYLFRAVVTALLRLLMLFLLFCPSLDGRCFRLHRGLLRVHHGKRTEELPLLDGSVLL